MNSWGAKSSNSLMMLRRRLTQASKILFEIRPRTLMLKSWPFFGNKNQEKWSLVWLLFLNCLPTSNTSFGFGKKACLQIWECFPRIFTVSILQASSLLTVMHSRLPSNPSVDCPIRVWINWSSMAPCRLFKNYLIFSRFRNLLFHPNRSLHKSIKSKS